MRVVLDTNVIVSAAMTTHGTCGQIVDLLAEGMFEICVDDRVLDEYDTPLLEAMYLDPDRRVRQTCAKWKAKLKAKYASEGQP